MELVKVGAAVLNQTPLDWASNRDNILNAIEQARHDNVSILCLPELCVTGYGCEDAFHAPGLWRTAWDVLQEIIPTVQDIIVSLGMPIYHQGGLYNTACLVVNGQIHGFVAKRFLAGDGIHYEPRWFKAWPVGAVAELEVDDVTYPLGDLIFDCGGIKLGFEICEDAWVANRPGGQMALDGVDIILNPSASHFAFGKFDVRQRFALEGSRAYGVTYVYSNLLGNESGRAIYDGGALIASAGQMMASGPRFSFRDVQLTSSIVDLDITRMSQSRTASFAPDVAADQRVRCIDCDFDFPKVEPVGEDSARAEWESSPHIKEEEFARTIALALFDYMRKSRSNGFVVSLSGGADSAGVACLVRMMADLAVNELGVEGMKAKLGYFQDIQSVDSVPELMSRLLLTVYQATDNSSDTTRNAAESLAHALDAEFWAVNVDPIVGQYTDLVESQLGRQLEWETDDIALQNIQARVRAPSVWMATNVRGALLLSTSNRSEAAVGYATMDGDTCGGVSPIAGIDKAFLRQWLRWLQTDGPIGLEPIPALVRVNDQQPTAELRPRESGQTDESDLMPYPVLDAVERAAIRDKKMPLEIWQLMKARFTQYDAKQMAVWIERFFRLWSRNQWKRERYAPSFHVDDENLDPKTWCRFPILSGGFERELQELAAQL